MPRIAGPRGVTAHAERLAQLDPHHALPNAKLELTVQAAADAATRSKTTNNERSRTLDYVSSEKRRALLLFNFRIVYGGFYLIGDASEL